MNRPICKIADFGLSRGLIWSTNLEGKVVDNPIWLAPEILRRLRYSEKVDVYAFGVILWELMTGEDFFGETAFMSAIEDRVKKGERPTIPSHTPSYFKKLIEMCWADNPESRPSFVQTTEMLVNKQIQNIKAAPSRVALDDYSVNEKARKEKVVMEKKKEEELKAKKEKERLEKERLEREKEKEKLKDDKRHRKSTPNKEKQTTFVSPTTPTQRTISTHMPILVGSGRDIARTESGNVRKANSQRIEETNGEQNGTLNKSPSAGRNKMFR